MRVRQAKNAKNYVSLSTQKTEKKHSTHHGRKDVRGNENASKITTSVIDGNQGDYGSWTAHGGKVDFDQMENVQKTNRNWKSRVRTRSMCTTRWLNVFRCTQSIYHDEMSIRKKMKSIVSEIVVTRKRQEVSKSSRGNRVQDEIHEHGDTNE